MAENLSAINLFYLYRKLLFPYCNITVRLRCEATGKLKQGDRLVVVPVRHALNLLNFHGRLGTLAEVLDVQEKEGQCHLQMKGLSRVRIRRRNGLRRGKAEVIEESAQPDCGRLREDLRKRSQELIFLINVEESDKLIHLLNFIVNIHQLTDFIANYFVVKFPARLKLYRELDVVKRASSLLDIMEGLIDNLKKRAGKEVS